MTGGGDAGDGMLAFDRAVRGIALAVFAAAALAAVAAAGLIAVDIVLRYAFDIGGRFYSIAETLTGVAVLLGAPAALYVLRDPHAPRAPRWSGRGAGLPVAMILASLIVAFYLVLKAHLQRLKLGDIDIGAPLGPIYAAAYAGLAALILLTVAALAAMSVRRPVVPVALLALAAIFAGASFRPAFLQAFGNTLITLASALGTFWPALAASAIAGAIAALRPGTGIAAIAAPALLATLAATTGNASIGDTMTGLLIPALAIAVLHAALGILRGFRTMVDDLIGLALLLPPLVLIAPGIATPTETACVMALPVVLALALVAVGTRGRAAWRPLASGLAHGIGAGFAVIVFAQLFAFAAYAGWLAGPTEAMSGLSPVLAGLLGIALVLVLAAMFGAPVAVIAGVSFLVAPATAAGFAMPPFLVALVLAGLAGGALFPAVAPWLAGGAAGAEERVSFRAALLGAAPPLALAIVVMLAPSLVLGLN